MGGRRLTYSIVTEAPAVPAGDAYLRARTGSALGDAHSIRKSLVYLVPTVALVAATVYASWPNDTVTPQHAAPGPVATAAPASAPDQAKRLASALVAAVETAATSTRGAQPADTRGPADAPLTQPIRSKREAIQPAAATASGAAMAAPTVIAALPPAEQDGPDWTGPSEVARADTSQPDILPTRPRGPVERPVRMRRGDTLMNVLMGAGVSRQIAHEAITALRTVFDPRRFRTGQEIILVFTTDGADRFVGFRFDPEAERTVTVTRADDGSFSADEAAKVLSKDLVRTSGEIDSSLFEAGVDAGVPTQVMFQLIQLYSFDVDFQRDVWAGDAFEVMFENLEDEDGQVLSHGDILYASLTLRGQVLRLYRFTPANGRTDYFNEHGESMRKMLMRTPIDGARLTSTYGRRRHPILGYTRMHRGIDFAAPRGTPIYAAGDGTVTSAGRNGAYGRYIEIRHNSSYSTAYAHLNGIANGVSRGIRVTQGQVIGYVGSTGRSTGPHLHYEIHRNGHSINPLNLRMAGGEKLKGKDLDSFASARLEIDARYASLARDLQVARDDRKEEHACASPRAGGDNDKPATC